MLSREEQQVLEDQKLSCQGAIKVLTKARDCQFASDVDESYASWVESHNELIKHQEALLGAIDSALQSLDAKDAEIAHLYSAVALGDKFLARKDAEITSLRADVREWVCASCNHVYPGPPQDGLLCVICPHCGGDTMPKPAFEIRKRDAEITHLEARVQSLFASADEMARIIAEERKASAERIAALEKKLASCKGDES